MTNFEQRVKQAIRQGPDIDLGGVPMVTDSDGSDIFDAVNNKLAELGPDQAVMASPDRYNKANNKAVSTQLQPQAADQMVHFWGADVQLADGVDIDPVNITENGFEIIQLNIDANRNNNTLNAGITTSSGLSGMLLDNIEFNDVPIGIDLFGISDSIINGCKTDEDEANVDTCFLMNECNDVSFLGNVARNYTDKGIELRKCDSMLVRVNVGTAASGTTANEALLIKGTTGSSIECSVNADGGVSEGVVSETFDPGGANEEASGGNQIETSIDGVIDVPLRVSDSEQERIDVTVNGNYDGGKSNKVFDFDSPNGINAPQHIASINSKNTDNVTDTSESGTSVAVILDMTISRVTNTDSITLAGDSTITPSLGVGLPNPAMTFGSDTSVNTRRGARRNQTDGSGQVTLDWSNSFAFTDKPSISVILEQTGIWYITSYTTDGSGRFTGATIQVEDSGGAAVGSGVNVTSRLLGT